MLLKKGGKAVYFGELGDHSRCLVEYFEKRGAKSIERGENPANWVLTAMTSGSRDYAAEFLQSEQFKKVKESIAAFQDSASPDKKLSYDSEYACPKKTRGTLTSNRLMKIYWRSPNYNRKSLLAVSVARPLNTVFANEVFSHWLLSLSIIYSIQNDHRSRDCYHHEFGTSRR